ncbi:MAG: HsdR family type I site-specific deoxyribonuclease, partial [Anaerolineales bacterium]|nr:HsdR family type I site-specific deoxyribonuclease [Anaerolineales bacterium]
MIFNEENSVEQFIRDLLCGEPSTSTTIAEPPPRQSYQTAADSKWSFFPASELPRQTNDVYVVPYVRKALVRLNPSIAAQPERADEVLYKLRAIVRAVRSEGLIRANELFTEWLRNGQSMPFGLNHEHVTIRLIDYDHPANNHYVLTTQYTFRAEGGVWVRPDLVLLVNGFPLVVIETKTPVRLGISWLDGARDIQSYERDAPELFACHVLSIATEGKSLRYGSIGLPLDKWGPWHLSAADGGLLQIGEQIRSLLHPATLLDILAHFTLFATDGQNRRLKIVCRYQQYEGANLIVERVKDGGPRKGLIWHFQGSGKSLLMVFAAQKLRLQPELRNPAVLIVVDRVDLDAQISSTFHASDVPNLVKAESRADLELMLRQDLRKIIITTIFKFGEVGGNGQSPLLNDSDNIIVLVDEAHRTQEGDLGMKMRAALPNAFLFGLTGTPINKRERNTFFAFGSDEDDNGYLSRYGFEESIRDGATLPLHFEPRLHELHIDRTTLDEAFAEMTSGLSNEEKEKLSRAVSRMGVLIKFEKRVAAVCADIATHFQQHVAPNGFKGMVVTFDQESCLLYKAELDKHLPPEASDVVISASGKEKGDKRYAQYDRSRDQEEKLLDRFRDPNDSLQLLIVTAKLLTGFDAPILQVMYLDKPLKDHTLLQAICRTNRTYGSQKAHGLIVDYLGVFDDVAEALAFDEQSMQRVASELAELKDQLPAAVEACLRHFAGLDRTLGGYRGVVAAEAHLATPEAQDAFAADYGRLSKLWEALSPDSVLGQYRNDYRWLSQIYAYLQPRNEGASGAALWQEFGAKTLELVNQHVDVETLAEDVGRIIVDASLVELMVNQHGIDNIAAELEER